MKKIFVFITAIIAILLNSCVSSYHIQVFSDNVEVVPVTRIDIQKSTAYSGGSESPTAPPKNDTEYKEIYEGIFKGDNLESVMQQAQKEGYNKILSIEYGTNTMR